MAEENHRVKVAGYNVDLKEEDQQIEHSEWEVSGHDVPHPVPADIVALLTGKTEGVGQGIVVRQTPPTQGACSVH